MPQIQFAHGIVHTPEQVRDIVQEAGTIADELTSTPEAWAVVFTKAADLLGARSSLALQEHDPTTAAILNGIRRGGV